MFRPVNVPKRRDVPMNHDKHDKVNREPTQKECGRSKGRILSHHDRDGGLMDGSIEPGVWSKCLQEYPGVSRLVFSACHKSLESVVMLSARVEISNPWPGVGQQIAKCYGAYARCNGR